MNRTNNLKKRRASYDPIRSCWFVLILLLTDKRSSFQQDGIASANGYTAIVNNVGTKSKAGYGWQPFACGGGRHDFLLSARNKILQMHMSADDNSNDQKSNNNMVDEDTEIKTGLLFDDSLSRSSSNSSRASTTTSSTVTTPVVGTAQFGQVVSLRRPSTSTTAASRGVDDMLLTSDPSAIATPSLQQNFNDKRAAVKLIEEDDDQEEDYIERIKNVKRRNIGVAILSIALAISNYIWQLSHPITPIQILSEMERQSVPISIIGTNNKPTVIDFWAPWCENCKLSALTLETIENKYRDQVNFVMINADNFNNNEKIWDYIETFGVDAIPHLALLDENGYVETALIGPIPKRILEQDIDVLLSNTAVTKKSRGGAIPKNEDRQKQQLPVQMYDAFANRPEQRTVHFDP